jgi:hypothetical protein
VPLADGRSFELTGFADGHCARSDRLSTGLFAIKRAEVTEEIQGGTCKRASYDQLKKQESHLEKI